MITRKTYKQLNENFLMKKPELFKTYKKRSCPGEQLL